jgi:hypothetical protein
VTAGTPCVDDLSRYKTAKESPYKSVQEMEFAPTLNWAKLKWFDDLKWSSLSKEPEVRKKQVTMKRFEGVPHAFMHMDAGKFILNSDKNLLGSFADKVPLALPQARYYIEMLSEAIRNSLVVEI